MDACALREPPLAIAEAGGQADLANPDSVRTTIENIFDRRFGEHWPRGIVAQAFADVAAAYRGDFPGLLACDTPYHDLRHTLDTALVMARLVDGHEAGPEPLGAELCVAGVVLALFHDIGYLRRRGEEGIAGARLAPVHEARGVDFAAGFFRRQAWRRHESLAPLILATAFQQDIAALLRPLPAAQATLARLLASADVLSQVADRCYLERCRDFLYTEFVVGGLDRTTTRDGREQLLYGDAEDLLRKTPAFFESVVVRRLEHDLQGSHRHLDAHFGGRNPYIGAMVGNIGFLREVIAGGDFSRLRRQPKPLYCARAA